MTTRDRLEDTHVPIAGGLMLEELARDGVDEGGVIGVPLTFRGRVPE